MNILQKIWYKDRDFGAFPINVDWPSGDVEIQVSRRIDIVFHFWTKEQKLFAFHKTVEIDPKFTFNLPVPPHSIYITEADLDTFIDRIEVNGLQMTANPAPISSFKRIEHFKYPRWKLIWRKIKRVFNRTLRI